MTPRRRVPLASVTVTDGFFAGRIETIRRTTLEHQYQNLVDTGRLDALRLRWKPGDQPVPHIFWDSDVAKWIEAASYCLATAYDPELDLRVGAAIDLLGAAQQPDGYLNSYYSNVAPELRFTDLRDGHELYCAGHLIEAAVAHHEATGGRALLDIARRYADLIVETFGVGPDQVSGYDGHPEIELALVRLYECTDDQRYLDAAAYFVDQRGQEPYFFAEEAARRGTPGYFGAEFPGRDSDPAALRVFREYQQTHLPVREQATAVGHCVRAMYLYSAMTDLAQLREDQTLLAAVRRLWSSVVERRMYVTGAVGSSRVNEGWTEDYDLPNETAYNETCASIGLFLWAFRIADIDEDGAYIDVAERALYNGVLSGMSMRGTEFFYENPLASDGTVHRQPWFGVSCCPPNLARLLTSLGRYVYTAKDAELRVNLFVGSELSVVLGGVPTVVRQSGSYPWSGRVQIEVEPDRPAEWTLSVRIPAWADGASVSVNGEEYRSEARLRRGFLRITRRWAAGDRVVVDLPLTPRRERAHPRVVAAAGRVAILRGPIVHCVEGVDNGDPVERLHLPEDVELRTEPASDATLGEFVSVAADTPSMPLTTVPYFLWDNRQPSTMGVWIRSDADADDEPPSHPDRT
ncbi:glycoside hydrolase family 127 protein [Nocardioides sp. PD653-B2]|uniref:glycoside hydrolase family 127 protein n=1 Tax=Nocardioides sp. PD653-B2 TaxID=1892811 RepID=UPI0009F14E40|nr:beta-L-arabinofuranosidase domain-containing protein [Nocardioides sp. PD653-B2]GAW50130.1 uncharacterized protein PD653B2_2461 [Nocardioides sp. PD653-B2]GAW54815.1 uncharacterized protein PD653_2229 [Nocardioides sp. PD653]